MRRHAHSSQDEFIYVVEGQPTLVTSAGETLLRPGICAGFKAGTGDAVSYPDDDIQLVLGADGKRRFIRKDGSPY